MRRGVAVVIGIAMLVASRWTFGDRVGGPGLHPVAAHPTATRIASRPSTVAARLPRASMPGNDIEADSDPQRIHCLDDRRRQLQQRLQQLGTPDSPDAAIEHALLARELALTPQDFGSMVASRELTAARSRWPDDIELAWFSTQQCSPRAGCDPAAEWRHLATLDPDNAAVWLLAMSAATNDKDTAGFEQALQRAAAARTYDSHAGLTFLHLRSALVALPMPDSCGPLLASLRSSLGRRPTSADWADLGASSMEAATGLPTFGALAKGCRASQQASSTRRQDCIAVLSKIANGKTLAEQVLAAHLLVDLLHDAPDGTQWRERYRRLAWLQQDMRTPRIIAPGEIARSWTQGEVAVAQARAISEGRWPPPPDWQPGAR